MARGPKKEVRYMSGVAGEIIRLKFKPTMTLLQVERKFYHIMKRHGIKYGTKEGAGVNVANFEWTMCEELFLDRVRSYFQIDRLFLSDTIPKDLYHY